MSLVTLLSKGTMRVYVSKGTMQVHVFLKKAIVSMKVPELIHSAVDGIVLSQLLNYVTVINVTNICLLSASLMYYMVKM